MLGSEILDVAVGIVFVFLLVSLIASGIREGIEGWLKTRATHLEAGIRELLHDPKGTGLTKQLFDHPLIYNLYSGRYTPRAKSKRLAFISGANLPAYIPSRNFAVALMDLAARGPVNDPNAPESSNRITLQTVRANISLIQNPPVQRAILLAIDTAEGDLQKAQANLEAWYDSTMDRVSGWYKRSTQWILFAIGLAVAIAMNVNAISIGDYLTRNKTAREALVAHAQAASSDPNYQDRKYSEIKNELQSFTLPIGWDGEANQFKAKPFPTICGWLLTALAASLGAPVWFDLLNKFMVVRSTVKPHQKSPEEGSEDRQIGDDTSPAPPADRAPSGVAQRSTGPPAVPHAAALDLIDGCDVKVTTVTADEDLPPAEGGIA